MTGWILWLALSASWGQIIAGCNTTCPDGYLKVCVDRNDDCTCSCLESAGEGVAAIREILSQMDVSEDTIEEVIAKFSEAAEKSHTDDSLDFRHRFQDRHGNDLVLRVGTSDGSSEDLALQLYRVSGPSNEDVRQMMRDMLSVTNPDEPAELWDELLSHLDFSELAPQVAPLYSKHLTDDEIREAIRFYRSPAGQKLVRAQIPINQESMEIINQWMLPKLEKVFEQALSNGSVQSGPLHDSHAQKETVAKLRNIGTGILSWLVDQIQDGAGRFLPEQEDSETWSVTRKGKVYEYRRVEHSELVDLLVPHYLPSLPSMDGWGFPLEFAVNKDLLGPYVVGIRSRGRDGAFEGAEYEVGYFPMDQHDHDVVWVDGYFARWPSDDFAD